MFVRKLYHKFFAKGQPLRHPAQHLLLALTVYLSLVFFSILPPNSYTFALFTLGTFLIDIDGFFSIILGSTTMRKGKLDQKIIINDLEKEKFFQAGEEIARDHKEFNRLFVHNIVGFVVITTIFCLSIINRNQMLIAIVGAILTHFILDIVDDYDKLGHLNNWLWPIKTKLFKYASVVASIGFVIYGIVIALHPNQFSQSSLLEIFIFNTLAAFGPGTFFVPIFARSLNPLAVSLVTALGMSLNDSVTWYLGSHARNIVQPSQKIQKIKRLVDRFGVIGLFILSLIPLPYDFVALVAGYLKISYRQFFPAMFLGKLFRFLILAYGSKLLF